MYYFFGKKQSLLQLSEPDLKLKNLKYGLLISASTIFSGGVSSLYAQENNTGTYHKVERISDYKTDFLQSISADKEKLYVDFMVDSVAHATSNGDLLTDINVIELLAVLGSDTDEYQASQASKHIVAHEMWHRICLMKGVLEQPMSASQFRAGLDNFEVTANILTVLSFRDDYIHANKEEREIMLKSSDPKIVMYAQAVKHNLVHPLSDDKKDFDFEMRFIANMVSNFWHNNMSDFYADYHDELTRKSGRKEFTSPLYDKNFTKDIKVMNTIGGIDFSKYYDIKLNRLKKYEKGDKPDTKVLNNRLSQPNYNTWINKKSRHKRYSKQSIEISNFAGNTLAKQRAARPYEKQPQKYEIMPYTTGYKNFPKVPVLFMSAIELKGENKTYKIYANGSLDEISPKQSPNQENITTYNQDGSFEKGTLLNGRKNGTFIYYDAQKHQICTCSFKNGKAQDGMMIGVYQQKRFYYTYQKGELIRIESKNFKGQKIDSFATKNKQSFTKKTPLENRHHDMIFDVCKENKTIALGRTNDAEHPSTTLLSDYKPVKSAIYNSQANLSPQNTNQPNKSEIVITQEKSRITMVSNVQRAESVSAIDTQKSELTPAPNTPKPEHTVAPNTKRHELTSATNTPKSEPILATTPKGPELTPVTTAPQSKRYKMIWQRIVSAPLPPVDFIIRPRNSLSELCKKIKHYFPAKKISGRKFVFSKKREQTRKAIKTALLNLSKNTHQQS